METASGASGPDHTPSFVKFAINVSGYQVFRVDSRSVDMCSSRRTPFSSTRRLPPPCQSRAKNRMNFVVVTH
jgi:hypothetical protein